MRKVALAAAVRLGLFACFPEKKRWQSPSKQLPKASHAYGLDIRRVFKIRALCSQCLMKAVGQRQKKKEIIEE